MTRHRLRQLIYPYYKKLETSVHPLRYLFLEITQRCNLNCLHCGSDCGSEIRQDELSTEEWLDFFAYLDRNLPTKKMILAITGGEPLCHPQFDLILQGLKRHNLAWGMVTNGYALSNSKMKSLIDHRISSLMLSLDGLEESHDWLRGVRGAFKKTLASLNILTASSIPFFDVVTCVNPVNLPELPSIQQLLVDQGVRHWRLFSIFPIGRARNNSQLILSETEFRQLLNFIRFKRKELTGSSFHLQFSCEGYLPRKLDEEVRDHPYFCRAGINIGSVLCDGSISACPNISRSFIQGNIRTDDFKTVWETGYSKFRDRQWLKTGPCIHCGEWQHCLGNSLHLWNDALQKTEHCIYQTVSEHL